MSSSEDAFEFYPCLVDGEPASIYVNLRYEDERPPGADWRYELSIRMRDAGPHGVGTAEEADALNQFEEATIARLTALTLTYVGRMRSRGIWEIVFYGPAGRESDVRDAASWLDDRSVEVKRDRKSVV